MAANFVYLFYWLANIDTWWTKLMYKPIGIFVASKNIMVNFILIGRLEWTSPVFFLLPFGEAGYLRAANE